MILERVYISDDDKWIVIKSIYNQSIVDQQLDVYYDSNNKTVYQDILSINLEYEFPLHYCVSKFEYRTKLFYNYSMVLQYLYFIFFVYAVVCNNKLIAI